MKLYHGSNVKIDSIDLSLSKPNKDFGRGFYLSDSFEQAWEMARFKTAQLGGNCEVTVFEFDRERLFKSGLAVKIFEDYSEQWVDFVIENRNGLKVYNFDFIYGPIANDKVGRQLRLFNDKDITKQQLIERLKYFKGLTFQYFFGSERSIEFLTRIDG